MIFNLIPIPPFDGSRFFALFLPDRLYFSIMRYERYYMIAVIALSFLCSRFFNISPAGFLAGKLFDLISNPIITLLSNIYFG
jgi:Zn-dependent protease